MKKTALIVLIGIYAGLGVSPGLARGFRIAELEFKQARVIDVIRVLAEDAGTNIIATPEAGDKEVTLFLKNVNLEQALKAICRISDLWYRHSDGAYRLMTKEQYGKELVVGEDDAIRVFQLHNPNVTAVASAIEDLFDNRVEVSYGEQIGQNNGSRSGGNNNGNRNNNNRIGGRGNRSNNRNNNNRSGGGGGSGRSRLSERNALPDELTVEQLAALAQGGGQVTPDQLSAVSGINKMIYVTVNIEHNLLIVKTSDNRVLNSIAELVKQLDRPQTQVMLEMKIVDIKVGEDFSSLFDFELTNTGATGDSINPIILGGGAFTGGGSLVYEYISKHIKANIEFLEQNNRLNVVSNPMVVASNHRPATLFVGEERVMVRGYSIDTVDTLNNTRTITTPETEIEEIGTTLEITPHINHDGSVHIIFRQENATLNESGAFIPVTNSIGGVVNLPVDTITTARLEGEVFAKHGYTVAVGGLIRESFSRSRRKAPYLADIPVLGTMFRSTIDEDSQSEMVLLITPYILNEGDQNESYDPAGRFNKYAPGLAFQAKKLPEKDKSDPMPPVCGEYCSPKYLKESDL